MLGRHGYFYARRYDEAAEQLCWTLQTDSTSWLAHNFSGWVYLFQGRISQALTAFEAARQLDTNPETLVGLGYAFGITARPAKARECLDALAALAVQRYVAPINLALVYIALGDLDAAFTWLHKACNERSQWLSEIRVDPAFDPLRGDPRFIQLLERLCGSPQTRVDQTTCA